MFLDLKEKKLVLGFLGQLSRYTSATGQTDCKGVPIVWSRWHFWFSTWHPVVGLGVRGHVIRVTVMPDHSSLLGGSQLGKKVTPT